MRYEYPDVLAAVCESEFPGVMTEVLFTPTLQDYSSMIAQAGLALAPGDASFGLPESHDVRLEPATAGRVHCFDGVRRKVEESSTFGLRTTFLASEVGLRPAFPRTTRSVAVSADFVGDRLDRQIQLLGEAAEVLPAQGIRAGLRNHVGTWVRPRTRSSGSSRRYPERCSAPRSTSDTSSGRTSIR